MMVTTTPKRTNHILHLLLTVFTLGLWLPVWVIVAFMPKRKIKTITRPL